MKEFITLVVIGINGLFNPAIVTLVTIEETRGLSIDIEVTNYEYSML